MCNTQPATYRNQEDGPFLPKDIFSQELFLPHITVEQDGEEFRLANTGEGGSYVLAGEFGKCYEVKFSPTAGVITAMFTATDPRTAKTGDVLKGELVKCDFGQQNSFMYVCRSVPEYLVICISGVPSPVYIGERTILHDSDTTGPWFVPEPVGSLTDPDGTYGNYQWKAEQVIENLYEPYRAKYPEYITRTHLGKDQSGTYDMYGYIYEPKDYEVTFFLTGGIHATEEPAYYSLAKLLQLISDAEPSDPLFYPLREKVRFIVVPVVNVWGVSQNHDRTREEIWKHNRYNSENVDLNRDFGETTQQETKNVLAFFHQYADQVDMAMDFHNSKSEHYPLWYNFINYSVNSQANYKTTNHMYHRLMEIGLCDKMPNIKQIPGSYHKNSKYLEGRLWNEFHVPTITVEHIVNASFPPMYSNEGLTLGVETYGNFLIQNALFFIQHKSGREQQ